MRFRTWVMATCLGFASAAGWGQTPPAPEQLLRELGCAGCHDGVPADSAIRDKAPDLSQAGLRFNPDYLLGFLQYPVRIRQNMGASRMPDFRLDEREALALALFLSEQVPEGRELPDRGPQPATEKARTLHPEVTPVLGRQIFRALNCVACHRQSSIPAWKLKNAPDLSFEGARVRPEWLTAYLRAPQPVRPFGFYPGSGSRHPDFHLSQQEVEILAPYLEQRRGVFDSLPHAFQPKRLLNFSMDKAAKLLKDKLPCLGCHRLGTEGGIVGPDLSSLRDRLQPEFVYQMVRDPRRVMPETIMPKVGLPPGTLELIVNYLLQQELPARPVSYLSLAETVPNFHQEFTGGRRLHVKYCAPCHGVAGDGAGYNASYLPVPPLKHADSTSMARLPDDVLFDGIFVGGYVMNKSGRMPPWGYTLDPGEIRQLVAYLRQLCRCQGPAWSRQPR